MVKVLIDLTYINSESKLRESVALYAFNFLSQLSENEKDNITLLVSPITKELILNKIGDFKTINYRDVPKLLLKLPYIKGLFRSINWKIQINKLSFDCVYLPFSWSGNAGKTKSKKVITIHDLRPMREADRLFTHTWWFNMFGLNKIYLSCSKYFFTKHIKNANKVIGISNYVSTDLKAEWGVHSDKILTIYNSVSLPEAQLTPISNLNAQKFILYVNTLTPYKNIITLIKAFKIILNRDNKFLNYKLVVVGKPTLYWEHTILPYILTNHLSDNIIHIKYAADGELNWLYKSAKLFVSTSLHEGFGYTPIEAAISGCPIITTRCDSLPDVTDEKAFYYSPPTDPVALAETIVQVIENEIPKETLSSLSEFFKHRYGVKKQVEEIVKVISS